MAMGRPRCFDPDKVLDQALTLFWAKGYEGTSLTDITEATGVNKPSLYAAFGGKEQLFSKALQRYRERLASCGAPSLILPSARDSLEGYLRALATFATEVGNPQGCLLVQGALVGSEESRRASELLRDAREFGVEKIRKCLERARDQGELPADTELQGLARYFATVAQGNSVQAASGIATEQLHMTITIAMRCWPFVPPP